MVSPRLVLKGNLASWCVCYLLECQPVQSLAEFIARCQSWFKLKKDTISPGSKVCDFSLPSSARHRSVASAYLDGLSLASEYNAKSLNEMLCALDPSDRGVYYEGAAAGKTLSAFASNQKLDETLSLLQSAPEYSFVLYMGIGEAMAQLKVSPTLCSTVADNPWGGQIVEGYGFFDGYFRWFDTLVHQTYPKDLPPDLRAAYDQGLGRAIYFVTNGRPREVKDYIATFAPARQKELWAGLGQSTAYVGGPSESDLRKLLDLSGNDRFELMQGVLLGLSARIEQNYVPDYTEAARSIICGISSSKETIVNSDVQELILKRREYPIFSWQKSIRDSLSAELGPRRL
jgi:hypothetical protein